MATTTSTPAPATAPAIGAGPAPHRRGRRWRGVLIAAALLLLLAEAGVRAIEDRLPPPPDWYTTEYGTKQRQFRDLEAAGGASVVLIGSSVIDVSVDPSQLDVPATAERPAYNAGLIGANPEMVDLWSERVVEPALHPDVVVIGISSRDVNRNGAGLESQTEGFHRLPAVRHLLGTESAMEAIEWRAGELSHLFRYRSVLRRPLESVFGYDGPDRNLTEVNDLGQELHLEDSPFRGDPAVESFFRNEPLLAFAPSERQLRALRRAIDRLQGAGVRVILVDVPVTEQYIALHPRGAADYLDYEVGLNVLAAQTGTELVDAGIWPQGSFSDPLHLNGNGTDQLTALLDGYLSGQGVVLPPGAAQGPPLEGAVTAPVTTAP